MLWLAFIVVETEIYLLLVWLNLMSVTFDSCMQATVCQTVLSLVVNSKQTVTPFQF